MGVYYTTSIVWGLHVEHPDDDDGWPEELYEYPQGFTFSAGGNMMDSEGMGHVLHPVNAELKVLSSSSEGFGVFPIGDSLYTPSQWEVSELMNFAKRYGLPTTIGWFAISSVG